MKLLRLSPETMFLVASILFLAAAGQALGQAEEKELRPGGHLKIDNPNRLSKEESRKVYDNIAKDLAGFYAVSREPAAEQFRSWKVFNTAPYLSATHGNRYVNNYANARSLGYGTLKSGDRLPAGAIIAKDSFTVTGEGEVFGAALFIMEKLAAGKSPKTGDWRYVMILPDGSYFGDTTGDNADDVAYCHTCHKVKARTDYLFQIPKKYRP